MQHSALSEVRFNNGIDCRSGTHGSIGHIGIMGASRHIEAIVSLASIFAPVLLQVIRSYERIYAPSP
jgi:hypothetical protein